MDLYIISSATVCYGILTVNSILVRESYEDAVKTVQASIACDFGYDKYADYIKDFTPQITKENGEFIIYDHNGDHEETYRIEKVTTGERRKEQCYQSTI